MSGLVLCWLWLLCVTNKSASSTSHFENYEYTVSVRNDVCVTKTREAKCHGSGRLVSCLSKETYQECQIAFRTVKRTGRRCQEGWSPQSTCDTPICPTSCSGGLVCSASNTCSFGNVDQLPRFHNISRTVGVLTGGSVITLSGVNLNITPPSSIYFIPDDSDYSTLFPVHDNTVSSAESLAIIPPSAPSDRDYTLTSFSIVVEYTGTVNVSTNLTFRYVRNPAIFDIQPRTVLPTGGVFLSITGEHFDGKFIMWVTIETSLNGRKIATVMHQDCIIQRATVVHCLLPAFGSPLENQHTLFNITHRSHQERQRSKKRQNEATGHNIARLSVGFVIEDYVLQYQNNSRSTDGYVDLNISESIPKFDAKNHMLYDPTENGSLKLEGDNLSVGCSVMDYRVHIGAGMCDISSLSPTTLECNPPIEKPPWDPENQHMCKDIPNTLPLVVNIGAYNDPRTTTFVSCVRYGRLEIPPISKPWINKKVIAVGATISILALSGVTFLAVVIRRNKLDTNKNEDGKVEQNVWNKKGDSGPERTDETLDNFTGNLLLNPREEVRMVSVSHNRQANIKIAYSTSEKSLPESTEPRDVFLNKERRTKNQAESSAIIMKTRKGSNICRINEAHMRNSDEHTTGNCGAHMSMEKLKSRMRGHHEHGGMKQDAEVDIHSTHTIATVTVNKVSVKKTADSTQTTGKFVQSNDDRIDVAYGRSGFSNREQFPLPLANDRVHRAKPTVVPRNSDGQNQIHSDIKTGNIKKTNRQRANHPTLGSERAEQSTGCSSMETLTGTRRIYESLVGHNVSPDNSEYARINKRDNYRK